MERVGEEVVENDVAGNAERKMIECDFPLKPEGHNLLESAMMCASMGSDWVDSTSHDYTDRMEGKDLSRCVTSLAGSEPPCTSLCSMNDTANLVGELTVGNYGTQDLASVNNTNSSRQGQWQHLYHLASGSRCKTSHEDAVSQDKDQIWLRVREHFMKGPSDKPSLNSLLSKKIDQVPEEISPYLRAGDNKIISTNSISNAGTRLKTSSTSSFSQLFARKTSKQKGVTCRNPEVRCELGGAIVGQSDEKQGYVTKVASDALLKSSANNDLLSSHRVDRFGPESVHDEISLREWLKPGSRKRDKLESLHLFRQIVELVDFAHSQGVALQNLRPSCFKLLPTNRVIYTGSSANRELESAMNWDLSKKRQLEQDASAYGGLGEKQQKVSEDMKSLRRQPQFTSGCGSRTKTDTETNFCVNGPQESGYTKLQSQNHFIYRSTTSIATRQQSISVTAQLEDKWYTCPEELNERVCTFSSNIYGLGILLFELLCCYESWEVHSAVMLDLRNRILPPSFLSENPKEAGFCLWLLHPEQSSRPSTREILQSELICGSQELNSGDYSSILADNDEAQSELLLHFLISLKEQKQKHASKLVEDIECLEEDIKEVERRNLVRTSSVFSQAHKEFPDARKQGLHIEDPISSVLSGPFSVSNMNEAKLMRNIGQLEDEYFSMRSQIRLTENAGTVRPDKDLLKNRKRWAEVQNENEEPRLNQKSIDHLGNFFEGLCKFSRYSKLEVCGTLRNGDLLNSANVICSLSFDRDEDYIAAAGVSKRIKIFEFGALLNDTIDIHYPVLEMSNRSKLSCVCWNSYIKNYLASTDYDGVVKMWDASTGQGFSHYIEHQKRAWSIDFSQSDPMKLASGSDDCSVKLWSLNEKSSVSTIRNPANVCCIQFSAFSSNLLAFGSADYKVYCYDLRHTRIPWCTLVGHEKTVSYVKFLDSETLVSASTDNTLKLWDLNKTSSTGLSPTACSLTFSGHTNEKNFVGLSVLDGYIACGSETNEVYSYYRSFPMPITSHKFGSMDPISGHENGDDNGQFVSSVCWRRKSNMIVAANSSGYMKLLRMVS